MYFISYDKLISRANTHMILDPTLVFILQVTRSSRISEGEDGLGSKIARSISGKERSDTSDDQYQDKKTSIKHKD